ncbi:Atu1372/SO_1960 family protein (plasmid) [Agrobacterium leguminum]|uniref:Glutamine amidotransferase n=1 Tax=Agrobacterium deltaense NCPPB 1641 TaxID=1183425 RepID=A0A1S7U6Q2_9HYPH|nr:MULTISPECIES: Atu1372/SO_1960 family protein [Agrobacterium]WFS69803.1 Atu1372/SO_1960 family protein [Agrobacterium leguminum]CVI62594.1 putative glutamine amidotransferase [Agrobacterium deltaense NCPPB 1641]
MTIETTAAPGQAGSPRPNQRPLILMTPDLKEMSVAPTESEYVLRANYAEAIAEAGGIPMILPYEAGNIDWVMATADGIIITGARPGAEVPEARKRFERQLVEQALKAGKPLLGICHGMQLIGECLGGEFVTDLPASNISHLPRDVPDIAAHEIIIAPESALADWAANEVQSVNSLHRHALAGEGRFRVAARAPDGIIEAFEGENDTFCLGVQWHPEYRLTALDSRILKAFVERSAGIAADRPETCLPHEINPVRQQLSKLGLSLPEVSEPPGAFVGAVKHGNVVNVSGQVPLVDGNVLRAGIVGAGVSIEEARANAAQCLLNTLAQLERAAGGFDKVRGFVRLAGYVAASPDFTRHGAVIDGASELLRVLFPDRWAHARVAIGVASLPRGVPVEIELSAIVTDEA